MSFARSLFTVSSLTILSRIAGFVRDTMMASFLGTGPVADAFFVAQRFPNLFRSLFAEGAFSAAFVPLYTAKQAKEGKKAAEEFAGQALAILLSALLPFSALIIFFMPQVMLILAPGFNTDPAKFKLAVDFASITFPYLALISIGALQTGALNANGRFAAGAAAPIGYNFVMIAIIFAAGLFKLDIGYSLAWGVTLAGFGQVLWLLIDCVRSGVRIPIMLPRMGNASKQLLKRIGPGAVGAGASQINLLISTILSSTLPTGAVSYLFYADRLNQLPLGIVGIAVSTTLLPILARAIGEGRDDHALHYTSRAVEFCLLLGLPATFGLCIAAAPIIQTLFEHGAFDTTATAATAKALAAYALGIPAFLLVKVFASIFFARHDTATPVKVALIAMAVNVVTSLLLLQPLQHVGIALANSLAVWTNAILLFILLKQRKLAVADGALRKRAPRLVLSALGMAAVAMFALQETKGFFTHASTLHELFGLLIIIGAGGLSFAVLLHFTHAIRLNEVLAILRRKPQNKAAVETDPTIRSID